MILDPYRRIRRFTFNRLRSKSLNALSFLVSSQSTCDTSHPSLLIFFRWYTPLIQEIRFGRWKTVMRYSLPWCGTDRTAPRNAMQTRPDRTVLSGLVCRALMRVAIMISVVDYYLDTQEQKFPSKSRWYLQLVILAKDSWRNVFG